VKYSQGNLGRIFVIRLEDGDMLPHVLEDFAASEGVIRGMCTMVGGINDGSKIVVRPEDGNTLPPIPMLLGLEGVYEIAGVGTIFPDAEGKPVLHMHAALGRDGKTSTGCTRPGVQVWHVGEVILLEITDNNAQRLKNAATGFDLLEP